MTSPGPRVRRGAHRTRRDVTRALVPSLLAVLAVTSLITALYVWRGEDTAPPQTPAAATGALTAERDPVSAPPTSAAPTATSRPARADKTADKTASTKAATRTSTTKSSTTKTPDAATQAPAVAVVVLNQTRRSGLAGVVADRLRGQGWTVAGVGNFRGIVPATTVYYPAGAEAEAMSAANNLPTPARTRPRFGNLSTTRLTIVVTDNYPS